MSRKPATIEEQRNDIRRRYKNGSPWGSTRRAPKVTSEEELDAETLSFKKTYACFLKASDYSNTYIGDTLGVTTSMVKRWFTDDPKMREQVVAIQSDMMDGALKLMKTFALEGIEILIDVARRSGDDKVVIQAVTEILDRAGLTKVNKSESHTVKTERAEADLSPDFFSKLEGLPIETQTKLAQMAQEMNTLVADAKGTE